MATILHSTDLYNLDTTPYNTLTTIPPTYLAPRKISLAIKFFCPLFPTFSCDLNQIPYGYTVEVTYRFKGSDLIDTVPEELWMEVHDIVQEAVIKTILKKKKCKKAKWLATAAAAAKSLQSCPTLCDPIDGSPLGSPVPGILQARTLGWVTIAFSS